MASAPTIAESLPREHAREEALPGGCAAFANRHYRYYVSQDMLKQTKCLPLWDELFPAEQARMLRPNGFAGLAREVFGGVTGATVLADSETIKVHIPMTFKKLVGRNRVATPDGAEWAPRSCVDNATVKALARAFRWRGCWTRACMRRWRTWPGRRA